jgi:hypothetical protein
MQTIMRNTLKLTVVLLLVAALFGSGLSPVMTAAAACSPTINFDLWAKTGTATFYGSTTGAIWGYAANSGDPAGLPGPVLDIPLGSCVGVTLHNSLSETTSLLFQGQDLAPDLSGVAPGGSGLYTFTASKPGTFLYEAGLIPGAQHQVAMGLYGALIVRSATAGQAYASASTAFDAENIVVLSEYDPALATSPSGFDMRKYAPKYYLINGKAYPGTANITVTADDNVLLRYVNAGLQSHAMSLLGFTQTVIATDGSPFGYAHKMSAETIAPGQTLDTLFTAPNSVAEGSQFAFYDANMLLRNNTGTGTNAGLGGMLTFLTVTGGSSSTGPDLAGPLISSLTLSPSPNNGTVSVALAFTANDTTTGNNNVTVAEYWIDAGAHTAIPVGAPATAVTLNATIPAGLSAGTHVVSVHAQDALGNWSTTATINLIVDNVGPATSSLSLTPNPSNGAVSVNLSFNANDSAAGNSNVIAAEYWIDAGAHQPLTVASPGPVKTINATIPSGLSAGTHVIHARSQDAVGNWGPEATTVNLVVDNAGPATISVTAAPNPNNGTIGLSTSVQAVRVSASFSDAGSGGSNLSIAEGFLDVAGTTGTGFVFIANDGIFNSVAEGGYSDIPLVVVAALSNGAHPVCVHAKDATGNWGAIDCTYLLNIDKLPPTVSGLTLTPAATNNSAVAINANANDTASGNYNISAAEYFIDTAGAAGTGAAMTVASALPNTTISATIPATTIAALSAGNHVIYVRAKDAVGNWSTAISTALLVDRTPPTFSGISLSPNSIHAGTATVNLTVNGASDGTGGSGVTGGEYWFGSTNITPGTGTAFSGLTTSIATGSLTAGTYTVRVRIRDAVGNWSTGTNGVRTATLTVIAPVPDAIFSDGFESGNFSAWGTGGGAGPSTTNTTRLNVTSGAPTLFGTYKMQAQGNNTNYVQYNFGTVANPASTTFDARFYFNPNGNTGNNQDIFVARTTGGTTIFRVRYRWNGGSPQVQIQIGTSIGAAPWYPITNGSANNIEVIWQSGSSLRLYVGGVLQQTQTTTTTNSVGQFRVGSVTNGGSSTLEYFDAISAKRSVTPLIGP